MVKPRQRSNVRNVSQIIFKLGKDMHRPKISDLFADEGSASLNMRISILTFIDSFSQLESPT